MYLNVKVVMLMPCWANRARLATTVHWSKRQELVEAEMLVCTVTMRLTGGGAKENPRLLSRYCLATDWL